MAAPMTELERAEVLRRLPDWTYDPAVPAFCRTLKFRCFSDVIAAVARIGLVADRMNHHPEWSNVYDILVVRLTTHDADGVTRKDADLARAIDAIVNTINIS